MFRSRRLLWLIALALLPASPLLAQSQAASGTLVDLMSAGRPFLVVVKKDTVPLRAGDWSYPEGHDYWVAFEGRYDPESGIWQSDGVGFMLRNNEFHSCPPDLAPDFICGGVHSPGHRLSRRLTPSDHVVVILENELTFDDEGVVYRDGQQIGVITMPPAPY